MRNRPASRIACRAVSITGAGSHLFVDRLRRGDIVSADVAFKLFPDGFHHFDPGFALFRRQFADHAACVDDGLTRFLIDSIDRCVAFHGDLIEDRGKLVADCRVQPFHQSTPTTTI